MNWQEEDLKYICDNLLDIIFKADIVVQYDGVPVNNDKEFEKQIIGS